MLSSIRWCREMGNLSSHGPDYTNTQCDRLRVRAAPGPGLNGTIDI